MDVSPDNLTPGLERQLAHLELIGNAEAELAASELQPDRPVGLFKPEHHERRHRYLMLKRRYEREALRTRKLALWMLALAPVGVVAYLLAGPLLPGSISLLVLLFSGLLVGLALPSLYFANARLQELNEPEH